MSFKPGQLVRLRLHWDDIDDDIDMPEKYRTVSSPDYFALVDDGRGKVYKAISPGQVGVYLEKDKTMTNYKFLGDFAVILFGENKLMLSAKLLEALDVEETV